MRNKLMIEETNNNRNKTYICNETETETNDSVKKEKLQNSGGKTKKKMK